MRFRDEQASGQSLHLVAATADQEQPGAGLGQLCVRGGVRRRWIVGQRMRRVVALVRRQNLGQKLGLTVLGMPAPVPEGATDSSFRVAHEVLIQVAQQELAIVRIGKARRPALAGL